MDALAAFMLRPAHLKQLTKNFLLGADMKTFRFVVTALSCLVAPPMVQASLMGQLQGLYSQHQELYEADIPGSSHLQDLLRGNDTAESIDAIRKEIKSLLSLRKKSYKISSTLHTMLNKISGTNPEIEYKIHFGNPGEQYIQVELNVPNLAKEEYVDFLLPKWTPGSYTIRDYSRLIEQFSAHDSWTGEHLSVENIGGDLFRISASNAKRLVIHYSLFAADQTVRTNHMYDDNVTVIPAATFGQILGLRDATYKVEVLMPDSYPNWAVTSTLPVTTDNGISKTYSAATFDELADSPIHAGVFNTYDYEVAGVPHQLIVFGEQNDELGRHLDTIIKIQETEAEAMGGLPYSEQYQTVIKLAEDGARGGLEHRLSQFNIFPRAKLKDIAGRESLFALIAHEFFHLWNIKRLMPVQLKRPDFNDIEQFETLWFVEGGTSFFEAWYIFKSGVRNRSQHLKYFSEQFTSLEKSYGSKIHSLVDSSLNAWTKLYKRDHNFWNSQISYYHKGELVVFLMDLAIRAKFRNEKSFEDVFKTMWERYGVDESGYTHDQLIEVIKEVYEEEVDWFVEDYIRGTEKLNYRWFLKPFGLTLKEEIADLPYFGFELNGNGMVKKVQRGSPANKAGIQVGDKIIAVNREQANSIDDLKKIVTLNGLVAGDEVEIVRINRNLTKTIMLTLEKPQLKSIKIEQIAEPTEAQQELLDGWLPQP